MGLMLVEPEWIPVFAGKCYVAQMLSKQASVLPHSNIVLGGVLLSADTIQSGERSGKERQGTGERTEGLGWALGPA